MSFLETSSNGSKNDFLSPFVNTLLLMPSLSISFLNPNEALNAVTINGAFAMEIEKSHGQIKKRASANLIITKKIPSLEYIPYSMGENVIEKVIINGEIYHDSETNH